MPRLRCAAATTLLLALGAAGAAVAQAPADPTETPRTGAQSPWAQVPAMADFLKALPPETAKARPPGRALVRCRAQASGELSDCVLIADSAGGAGYGRALLAVAPQFKLKPERVAGMAPQGTVIIPYSYFPFDKAPDWLRKPTERDLLVVWPKAAWRKGLGGKATIACLVSPQGAVYDCVPTSESPPGENFGAAAVALTPQFLMRPATLGGQPVLSPVTIPINFAWQGGRGGGEDFGTHKVAQAAQAWPEAPSVADVAAAYPKKARAAKIGGRATLECEFNAAGRMGSCTTVTEEPKGQGFGAAAHALARKFRAALATSDGAKLEGASVQLAFVFDPSMLTQEQPAVGKPQWASLPNGADTAAAFGQVTKSVSGTVRVTLTCTVQQGGGVSDCSVAREEPAGKGVGLAALTLAPHFKLTTWSMEGLPTVGASVNIPLRYEGGSAAAAAPAPAAPAKP